MILFTCVLCVFALAFLLRLLWQQNRALDQLRQSATQRQPYLLDRGASHYLPGWPGLVDALNRLMAENSTLQQQRTDKLTQLEATLGNLREAVLIVDEANYVHLANRALREIFPAARNLVNMRLELIVRSVDFIEYVRATRAGSPLPRQEFEIVDGENTIWIEASGAPIAAPDGRGQWALFVIHNMTSQRKLERIRRDFVANASHELRTPLSIIKGYIETLVDGHTTMSLEDREKFLQTIQRHSNRLTAIIDDLLVLSRLESATPGLTYAAVELTPFLQSLANDYQRRPQAADYTISVTTTDDLGSIQADAEKLTQVLGNLVENALKYTPKGSHIEISARPLGPNEVECQVRDNGAGIPSADLAHIFERFYRVEKGRSRETGGTGLGLSIAKHIVQLHGGRVWAESPAGQGLTIMVRLPRTPKA